MITSSTAAVFSQDWVSEQPASRAPITQVWNLLTSGVKYKTSGWCLVWWTYNLSRAHFQLSLLSPLAHQKGRDKSCVFAEFLMYLFFVLCYQNFILKCFLILFTYTRGHCFVAATISSNLLNNLWSLVNTILTKSGNPSKWWPGETIVMHLQQKCQTVTCDPNLARSVFVWDPNGKNQIPLTGFLLFYNTHTASQIRLNTHPR